MSFTLWFLICLFVGLLLTVIYIELYHRFSATAQLVNKIPGPKGIPVFGSAGTIIDSPVFLWDPEDMQTVLSSMAHHQKSMIYLLFDEWLGEGLLTSNNDKWKHRRKILTPTFHFSILKRFISIFNKHSAKLVTDIENDPEKETSILPHIHKSSLHTIAEAAMGALLIDPKSEKKYRNAVHKMGEIAVFRLLRPWLYLYITNLFTLQFYQERFLLSYLKKFTKNVINEREKNFKESDINQDQENDDVNNPKRKQLAMLDLLLSAKNKGQIDYDGICEEVDTFMFEGHDTVSMSLQYTFMLIANHSDVQQRLYEEVTSVLDSDRSPTYDDLNEMTYMEMVIKESLRLYPSVPLISRVTGEEFIASSGHKIPAGSILVLNIFDTHRLEHIYPEPDKFLPERFTFENSKSRHPYAYLPFSAGPRNCIGQKYAMLNMKCKVAAIIQNFVLLPITKPEEITLVADFILRTKDDIKIKFKSRKQN